MAKPAANDQDVPEMALKALKAAQLRAKAAGRVQVFRNDRDQLIKVDPSTGDEIILKTLQPRKRISRNFSRKSGS